MAMTDKQFKSLSKVQMLDILHQQEKEIERLTAEANNPRVDTEASALLSGIMQAAKTAADSYVKNMVVAENEKIDGIAKLEAATRKRAEEAENNIEVVMETARKIITDMNEAFTWHIELIKSMQEEFVEKLNTLGLKNFFPMPRPPAYSEPETGAFTEPQPYTYAEPQTSPYAEPQTSPYSEPETDAYNEPEMGAYAEPQPGAYAEPQTDAYAEPQPGAYAEPEMGAYAEPETDAYAEPQTGADEAQQADSPTSQQPIILPEKLSNEYEL